MNHFIPMQDPALVADYITGQRNSEKAAHDRFRRDAMMECQAATAERDTDNIPG